MKNHSNYRVFRAAFVLCSAIFPCTTIFSQYHLDNLTGNGRPVLENPEKFSDSLRKKAEKIVMDRLGETFYYKMTDTTYRYEWYYNNVYFNSAPSEMNYRVAVFLRNSIPQSYHFEIKFSKDSLQELLPADHYLPDCRNNPSECAFITKEKAGKIAMKALKNHFKEAGSSNFIYDAKYKTFAWSFYISKFREYPYGDKGEVLIDANSGEVLEVKLEENVWMGKCLSENTKITTRTGHEPVQNIKPGDSVLSVSEMGEKLFLPVLKITKEEVGDVHIMIEILLDDGRTVLVSPAHPLGDGNTIIADLEEGELLDGAVIIELKRVPYRGKFTYDILTSGKNGCYFSNGIPMGSTLSDEFLRNVSVFAR